MYEIDNNMEKACTEATFMQECVSASNEVSQRITEAENRLTNILSRLTGSPSPPENLLPEKLPEATGYIGKIKKHYQLQQSRLTSIHSLLCELEKII